MKIFIKILNIIGAVLASLLMPLLIAALIAAPVVNAVSSFSRPDDIADMIRDLDLSKILDTEMLGDALEQAEIPKDAVEDILKLDVVADFAQMYLEDIEAQILDGQKGTLVDTDTLLMLADKHMNDIVELVRDFAPEDTELTDTQISEEVRSFINKEAPEMLSSLPAASDIIDSLNESGIDTEMLADIFSFIQQSLMPLMYTVIVFLSLLIFGLRAYRLEGTVWLGIDYILASAVLLLVSLGSDSALELASLELSELSGISTLLSDMITSSINPFALAYLIIGIVFIAAFVVIRITISKRRKAKLSQSAYTQQYFAQDAANANPHAYSAQNPVYSNPIPYSVPSTQPSQPETYSVPGTQPSQPTQAAKQTEAPQETTGETDSDTGAEL